MAKRKGEQIALIDDTLDNPTAKVADRFIELKQQLDKDKELLDIQEQNLLGLLKKLKKTQIRHKGISIVVKYTAEKEKLAIKGKIFKTEDKPGAAAADDKGSKE